MFIFRTNLEVEFIGDEDVLLVSKKAVANNDCDPFRPIICTDGLGRLEA